MVFSIPFILNGIVQTETRGALVGLAVAGIVAAYLKPKKYRTIFYSLAAVGLIGFIGVANQAFLERIKTLNAAVNTEQEWDNSARIRVVLAKAQIRMFADHPLGVGHQGTAAVSRNYLAKEMMASNSESRASHNTVMSILVDQGIPGIIIFVYLGTAVVSSLRKLKSMEYRGLSARYGIYCAMVGSALASILAAGMFAQYIKAEVLYWCIALLSVLVNFSKLNWFRLHQQTHRMTTPRGRISLTMTVRKLGTGSHAPLRI